jgi:hypothetical protein
VCAALTSALLAAALGVASSLQGATTPPPSHLNIKVGYDGTAESQDRPGIERALEFRDQLGGTAEMRSTTEGGIVRWYLRHDAKRVEGWLAQHARPHATLVGEGGGIGHESVDQRYAGSLNAEANLANAVVTVRAAEKRYDLRFLLMVAMASTWETVQPRRVREVRGASSVGGGRREESSAQMPLDAGPPRLGLQTGYHSLPVELKGLPLGDDAEEIAGAALRVRELRAAV